MRFKTKPYPFQEQIVEDVVNGDIPFYGLFLDPGLGKTKIALDIASNRIELGIVKRVWIVCPTYLIPSWEEQIELHTYWSGLDGFAQYEFITYGFLSADKGLPDTMGPEDLLIFDESHYLRVDTSARHTYTYKYFTAGKRVSDPVTGDEYYLPTHTPQILTLSGTPVARDWRDLYIQMFLLGTPCGMFPYRTFVQTFFTVKRKRIAVRNKKGNLETRIIVAHYHCKDEQSMLDEFKDRASFIKKADTGIKFPEKIFSTRYFELTDAQKKAYYKLVRDTVMLLETTSAEELPTFVKKTIHSFFQICSGFVMSEDVYGERQIQELVEPDKNPRILLLKDILESFSDQESCIVYTCYEYDANLVARQLTDANYSVALKHGGLSPKENQKAIDDFKAGRKRILVATIQSSSTGLNLQIASRMVYYSNSFELVQFMQGEDRIHRIDSVSDTCHYYYLASLARKNFPRFDADSKKIWNNPAVKKVLSLGSESVNDKYEYADHKLLKKLQNRKLGANLVFRLFNEILTLDNFKPTR